MSSWFNSWVKLALISLIFSVGGTVGPSAHAALTATLQTDRGCGGSARYVTGELITFRYSVSETAVVTLTLTRPDGFVSRPVFQQTVPAGVTRTITGIAGGVTGPRQLLLNATSASGSTQVECIYHVDSGTPQPPPGQFTASVTTDRGCGPTAVYQFGETSVFRVTVSQNAFVTLRLRYPDGTVRTLLLNEPLAAGSVRTITGIIGSPAGQRLLILDAVAGSQTAHAECTYTGGGTTPPPAALTLSVDRQCGGTYRLGEPVFISYRSTTNTLLTLFIRYADGSGRAVLVNQPVVAGQTYTIRGVAGLPVGSRTLTLQGPSGTPAVNCSYNVVP